MGNLDFAQTQQTRTNEQKTHKHVQIENVQLLRQPLLAGTTKLQPVDVLALQRTIGNQAFQQQYTPLIHRRVTDELREQHKKRGVDKPVTGGKKQTYAQFSEGKAKRPNIKHDHGFLDDGHGNIDPKKRKDPEWSDRLSRAKWVAKLETAELLRPDLVDATSTYRHFLFGNGKARPFSYERFIRNDSSGRRVLQSAIEDALNSARDKHNAVLQAHLSKPTSAQSFDLRTEPIPVGADSRYPYPATENWQKAIGAHIIWLEAHITVTINPTAKTRTFKGSMTLHMEDMYNFNPGMEDIATGTPDAENGRFEETGLGHEFLQTATATRSLAHTESLDAKAASSTAPEVSGGPRHNPRAPGDSRGRPQAR